MELLNKSGTGMEVCGGEISAKFVAFASAFIGYHMSERFVTE